MAKPTAVGSRRQGKEPVQQSVSQEKNSRDEPSIPDTRVYESYTMHDEPLEYALLEYANPDPANPAGGLSLWQIPPREFFAYTTRVEHDSLIYLLSGEIIAFERMPGQGGSHIGSIREGEVFRIAECEGYTFLVFNPSFSKPVRYLELLIEPNRDILAVTHQSVRIDKLKKEGQLRLIASASGRRESLTVHNDVDVYLASLNNGEVLRHESSSGRRIMIHTVRGCVEFEGTQLWQSRTAVDERRGGAIELIGRSDRTEILLTDAA